MILAKDDNKKTTLGWALFCSKTLMYLSMVIIILEFSFAVSFGLQESKYEDTFDQRYKAKHPQVYESF